MLHYGLMNRHDVIILAMQGGHKFTPVQIQKLFFLIDKNIGSNIGGPFFSFQPYDYGPFDKNLYKELVALEAQQLVSINTEYDTTRRSYQLTEQGQSKAAAISQSVPESIRKYMTELSDFVRKLSFVELVSAVYKAYPDMKVNSIFNE